MAPPLLSRLRVPHGRSRFDVACGNGALSAALLDSCSLASVTGMEPADSFLQTAQAQLAGRAVFAQGTAAAIPLADRAADVVVSGLVPNLVPDAMAALTEMARVPRSEGQLGGYVWDCSKKMELIRHFWDVAVELGPNCAKHHEGARFPLCEVEALLDTRRRAELSAPEVRAIDVPTVLSIFNDHGSPFLGGQGPAPAAGPRAGPAVRGIFLPASARPPAADSR